MMPCDRFGRRGTALLLLGLAWLLQGVAIILIGPMSSGLSGIPHENLSPWVLGGAWALSGLAGIVYGVRPTGSDTPGFIMVAIMPVAIGASYGVSWLTWIATGGSFGWSLGIFGLAIYGLLAALVGLIASWPETPPGAKGGDCE